LAAQKGHYPFLSVLENPIRNLQELTKKEYAFYLTELSTLHDDLLDSKEDIFDPIRKFMSGPARDIYDDSKRFLEEQNANFSDLEGDENQQAKNILADSHCFAGNKMQQLKALVELLRISIDTLLNNARGQARDRRRILFS